jgi:hypothetical protein
MLDAGWRRELGAWAQTLTHSSIRFRRADVGIRDPASSIEHLQPASDTGSTLISDLAW